MHAIDLMPTSAALAPSPRNREPHHPAFLMRLREMALQCRTAPRADLVEACAVLSADTAIARTAHLEVLVKCLGQAFGVSPRFYRPGVAELSFDEAWLVRLVECCERGDNDSFAFLLRSRVRPETRHNLAFLIRSISEYFSKP